MSRIEWPNFKLFVAERTGFDSRQPHQVTANVMSFAVTFFMPVEETVTVWDVSYFPFTLEHGLL